MNNWILPIALLLVSVSLMVVAVLSMRKDEFPDIKNEKDCEDRSKLPKSCQNDPNCCSIWQGGMCRKGKSKMTVGGYICESKGDVVPLLMLVGGVGFFIGFVVCLVKALRQK